MITSSQTIHLRVVRRKPETPEETHTVFDYVHVMLFYGMLFYKMLCYGVWSCCYAAYTNAMLCYVTLLLILC